MIPNTGLETQGRVYAQSGKYQFLCFLPNLPALLFPVTSKLNGIELTGPAKD